MKTQIDSFDFEITSAIEKDNADFFEQYKKKKDNWAFYEITDLDCSCLEKAVEEGKSNVVRKLFEISTVEKGSLNNFKYLGAAISALNTEYELEKAGIRPNKKQKREDIIKEFIKAGADPFYTSKMVKFSLLFVATKFKALDVISSALNSSFYPMNWEAIADLLVHPELDISQKLFLIEKVKNKFKILNIQSSDLTSFLTCLDQKIVQTQKDLEQLQQVKQCLISQTQTDIVSNNNNQTHAIKNEAQEVDDSKAKEREVFKETVLETEKETPKQKASTNQWFSWTRAFNSFGCCPLTPTQSIPKDNPLPSPTNGKK